MAESDSISCLMYKLISTIPTLWIDKTLFQRPLQDGFMANEYFVEQGCAWQMVLYSSKYFVVNLIIGQYMIEKMKNLFAYPWIDISSFGFCDLPLWELEVGSSTCQLLIDCRWEITAYFRSLPQSSTSKDAEIWVPTDTQQWQQAPLITPIKSMSSEPLGIQLYLEHPSLSEPKS